MCMCTNQVLFRGTSMRCGDTVSYVDGNGVLRREQVCCYTCARETSLRWSMAKCERYLSEHWDTYEPVDLSTYQAA